jgi:hypothetical protein
MRRCAHCGEALEARFRFCPFCGVPQRTKLVEFFTPHPHVPAGSAEALRVSRYFETAETPAHVRLSIWSSDRADAVIALEEAEATRLARFLVRPRAVLRRSLLDELRATLRV